MFEVIKFVKSSQQLAKIEGMQNEEGINELAERTKMSNCLINNPEIELGGFESSLPPYCCGII